MHYAIILGQSRLAELRREARRQRRAAVRREVAS